MECWCQDSTPVRRGKMAWREAGSRTHCSAGTALGASLLGWSSRTWGCQEARLPSDAGQGWGSLVAHGGTWRAGPTQGCRACWQQQGWQLFAQSQDWVVCW